MLVASVLYFFWLCRGVLLGHDRDGGRSWQPRVGTLQKQAKRTWVCRLEIVSDETADVLQFGFDPVGSLMFAGNI